MKYFYTNQKSVRGFTLIETLVASFVITMVILGPLTVASQAAVYAKRTRETTIANNLAQEAVELLRHQQDSVYIRCFEYDPSCGINVSAGETISQAAWRVFVYRLNTGGVFCLVSALTDPGCSYDTLDMVANAATGYNENNEPSKYVAGSIDCKTLSYNTTTHAYLCSGVHGSGAIPTLFSRTVKVFRIYTYGANSAEQAYNADLRVDVTVTITRPTGYSYESKFVDYLHARG